MIVETMLSTLSAGCHCRHLAHRTRDTLKARLAFTMAAFNLLVQWYSLQPVKLGFLHLSIADFSV